MFFGVLSLGTIRRAVSHKEANLVLTSLFVFLSLYVTFVALFARPFAFPLLLVIQNFSIASSNSFVAVEQVSDQLVRSLLSLFLLWVSALSVGHFFHFAHLPPLFGMLLVGIAFNNISPLRNAILIVPSWDEFFRKSAFLLILLRCAVGLDHKTLRKSFFFCTSFGILSAISEVSAIFCAAHFLFGISLKNSVLFGFVLASTSPAVTVPTMIHFQTQKVGTEKGIPTLALASASVDNVFSISAFFIAFSIISAPSDESFLFLAFFPFLQLFAAFAFGCLTGVLLIFFPRPNGQSLHFCRTFLLCSSSTALFFGFKAIKFDVSGPIAVLIASFVASVRWKKDNPKKALLEADSLRLCWDLLFLPLLFVLIGLLFDLSIFTLPLLRNAIVVISFGIIFRFISAFLLTFFNDQLLLKERLFFSTIFMPKATVQAALAPMLFHFAANHSPIPQNSKDGTIPPHQFMLQTCILSILLTAPIGQILIKIGGKAFLMKEEKAKELTSVETEEKCQNHFQKKEKVDLNV